MNYGSVSDVSIASHFSFEDGKLSLKQSGDIQEDIVSPEIARLAK